MISALTNGLWAGAFAIGSVWTYAGVQSTETISTLATPSETQKLSQEAGARPASKIQPASAEPWTKIATQKDKERIQNWREAMKEGRAAAMDSGFAAQLTAKGALYSLAGDGDGPDDQNNTVSPPPGTYRCATTKLGGNYGSFTPYASFRCQIIEEGGRRQFVKLTGSQRQVGYIYQTRSGRWDVFLGSLLLGDDKALVPYGKDPSRDQAAIIQQIGAARWRMIFPYPYYESVVDVMELTPVAQ
ncbi:MAG: DUF4893 domain-containing protein [Parasphingorhabdus sp.]|uniref:DUF4893 domain-containing protein n=1 Tax=Parasphingorhabdus sp. TaxID=2709688 RepID=UPI003299C86D